jgi:integrase
MPRKYELTWSRHHKRWIKTIDGKKYWFRKADRKSDIDAYKESLADYYELIGRSVQTPDESKSKTRSKRSGSYQYPSSSVAGCAERFMNYQRSRYDAGTITASTLNSTRWAITYFVDNFIKKMGRSVGSMEMINEMRITNYNRHLRRRYSKNELAFTSAKTLQVSAFQFVRWAWRNRYIEDLPRNIDDPNLRWLHRRNVKREQKIEIFSKEDIQSLLSNAYSSDIWCDLKAFILLALNCGFTPIDIGSLKWSHFSQLDDKIYIDRLRSKTGVRGRWLVWDETQRRLDRRFTKKKYNWKSLIGKDDFVFRSQQGRLLNENTRINNPDFIRVADMRITSNSAISRRFAALYNRTFPDATNRLSFKYLRKTGASMIARLDINNADRIAKTYLSHSLGSVADRHYIQQDFASLETALEIVGDQLGFHVKSTNL